MTDVLQHPDDALSALLDGELDVAEAAAVQAHVVACAACAAELDAVRDARAAVRSLPAVEPPAGFFEGLVAGGLPEDPAGGAVAPVVPIDRTRRLVWANVAAAVAASVMLLGGFTGTTAAAVAPEVGGAVAQHSSMVSTMSVGLGGSSAVPSIGPGWAAPELLAGYRLVGAEPGPAGVHLLYRKGPYVLSVFEQRGRLDRGELPEGGRILALEGGDAWAWRGRLLVLQRGGMVVTLVGDESADALVAAAEALPGGAAPSPSLGDRLRQACSQGLEMLSPAS